MQKTSIEWALNPDGTQGYSWNPLTGCLNGCEYCYARKLANTRLKERYLANENIAINGFDVVYIDGNDPKFTDPFYPRFWPEKLDIRRKYDYDDCRNHTKRRGVFVCDMSDLFGIGVPPEWTWKVLQMIRACPQDRFYLLTKQPQKLTKFSPFPNNCYVGVSATDTPSYQDACVGLNEIEAKVRFLSFEPLLGAIYTQILNPITPYYNPRGIPFDWVIIGAQTSKSYWDLAAEHPNETDRIMKYGKRWTFQPNIEWVREIVEACEKSSVKVFLKDSLKPLIDKSSNIVSLTQYGSAKLRQEFPNA
ncbi:hypothetical protein LCGC14_0692240 [marine sediment metagenome]|uniref:Phage protein Gp37/Gp68 n=1 Tax=marine sediment metagenome TaxID=412755 RepID=A0A0F9QQ25_9ZZZZ